MYETSFVARVECKAHYFVLTHTYTHTHRRTEMLISDDECAQTSKAT